MCLSLASPPNRILARLDVRTTLSKKFNDRNRSRGLDPAAGTEQLWRPRLLIEFKPFPVV
jgi:hypothetical protein